eukprot:535344-Pyramimonas_sp.AAC.1
MAMVVTLVVMMLTTLMMLMMMTMMMMLLMVMSMMMMPTSIVISIVRSVVRPDETANAVFFQVLLHHAPLGSGPLLFPPPGPHISFLMIFD